MNIEQAKTVALSDILHKLGFEPQKKNDLEATYFSPFREEKTPSFKVNLKKNIWYDFGEGAGGDIIRFATTYLEKTNEGFTVSDALRWLSNMSGFSARIAPVKTYEDVSNDPKLTITSSKTIAHLALVSYLEKRGIPFDVAKKYLREVRVKNRDTEKSMFALGFKNEDGGFELRNPFFKGCVGPKTVSFVRGSVAKPQGLQVFEGFMDFLSVASESPDGILDTDTIVLNSLACIEHATPYIKGYGYKVVQTWLDNDLPGERATKSLDDFIKTEENLQHVPMNETYHGHKDVNAWHMHKLGLKLE